MNEEWKPVLGYEGYYEVSNCGRVRSLNRDVYRGDKIHCKMTGRILKIGKTSTGYQKIELVKTGHKIKSFKVHRLVAFAFIPQIEGKEFINHKDSDRLNNNADNLEWCTRSENMGHAYQHGARKSKIYGNEQQIIKEYESNQNMGCEELGAKFGCDGKTIKRFLELNNIRIKTRGEIRSIPVDKNELHKDFEMKLTTSEIMKKHNLSISVVKRYKKQYKEGVLL